MNPVQLLGGAQTQFAPNLIARAATAPPTGSWGTRWFPEQEESRAKAQMLANRGRSLVGFAANAYSETNAAVAANFYFAGANANLFANRYFGAINLGPSVDLDANVGVGTNLITAANLDLGANITSPLHLTEEDQSSVIRATRQPISEAQRPDVVSRLAVIRDLIQNDRVLQARKLLAVIAIGAVEEGAVDTLRRALKPPTVRPSARRDSKRTNAYTWLQQHGHEYRGRWVAVTEGGLVADASTLRELRMQLEALALPQPPLIHKL